MISAFPDVPRRRGPVLPLLLLLGVCSCALADRRRPASADDRAAPAQPAVAAAAGDGVAGSPAASTGAAAAQPATATAPRAEGGLDGEGVRDPETVRATPHDDNAVADAAAPFAHTGAAEPAVSPAIEALLQRTLPELTFDGAGLKDVLEFVREVTSANVVIDWAGIEAAGVKRDAQVTLRVKNVSVEQGLRLALDQADGAAADAKLDFAPDGDVLRISTRAALGRRLETRVYDVRDLLVVIHDSVPAGDPLALATDREGLALEGEPGAAAAPPTTAPATQSPESLLADVVKLVRDTVDAGQWDGGPQSNTIRAHQGQLVISAPPGSHRQIAALMSQLRETRAVQVIVEARYITLDVAKLDGGLPEKLRQTFDRPGEPGVVSLSRDEVRAVMAGLAADAGTTVSAPRVMLFNGQRAYVLVGTQRAYISGWNVVVADEGGEKRYEPKHSTVTSGLVFDVQATAGLGRRDVTLMLRPKLTKLLDIDSAPFVGTADAPKDLLIQVPRLDVTSAVTLATVPDRGTLLLGGFRQRLDTPDGPATRPVTDLFVLVKPTIVVRGKAQHAEPEADPPAKPDRDTPVADKPADEPAEPKVDVK